MITKEQFLTFKQNNPLESIKASQLRDQAFESFTERGLPTKKDEAWKYTSLSYLKNASFRPAAIENTLNHEDMKWIVGQLDEKKINLVFTNGFFNRTLSDDVESFFDIAEISVDDFSLLAETEKKVTDLSRAFSFQKFLLNLSAEVEKVIQLTFVQTGNDSILVNPLVEIRLAEDVRAKIILNYISRGQKAVRFLNSAVQIHLAPNAHLQFLQIQNENLQDTHLSQVSFNLDRNANLIWLDLAMGAAVARHYLQVNFNGENAEAGVYGVVALSQDQHSDHYTFINHKKGLNRSIQKYKSILTDQSNSIFRGRIRIEKDAQKASSEQLNNSLMLSRHATVSSIPQLEIYADDVKAGHGSTVGQLNKEEMFYFLSRGIDPIKATKMMAYGFVLEMTSIFENKLMQEKVSEVLNEKLNGMFL